MNDLNVIDRFMDAFIRYIDSGFGLLGGDVGFLTSVLIGIDITLAGLFWALGGEDNVLGRFIKKILYVGAFALIINSFPLLTDIIFKSFAGLGLTAGGGSLSADDLLRPGKLAGTGFEAAYPLLEQVSELLGFTTFFDNFLTIAVLLIAWLVVIVAFFILAVQLFVTILEFKLTSLAGFILVPFALWNRTSFLAERVLGNVIGSGFFAGFITALDGQEPDIGAAMSLVLASLALFGLGIFGPAIASGLVAGAPQLGAGSAIGTAALAGGGLAVGGMATAAGTRALAGAGLGAVRAGTAMGSAASASYKLGQETSGSKTIAAGMSGVGSAAKGAISQKMGGALGLKAAAQSGRDAAWQAGTNSASSSSSAASSPEQSSAGAAAPAWAGQLRSEARNRSYRHAAIQGVKEGDRGGASAIPDIKDKED